MTTRFVYLVASSAAAPSMLLLSSVLLCVAQAMLLLLLPVTQEREDMGKVVFLRFVALLGSGTIKNTDIIVQSFAVGATHLSQGLRVGKRKRGGAFFRGTSSSHLHYPDNARKHALSSAWAQSASGPLQHAFGPATTLHNIYRSSSDIPYTVAGK